MTQTLDAAKSTRPPPSAEEYPRAALTQRLDDMAGLIGRLSHDFGNVLTGIMGFTELALLQLPPDSAAFRRVQEAYRAGEQGVQFLHRLNLMSQRAPRGARPALLQEAVTGEVERLRAAWGGTVVLKVVVPADLPPMALDAASLREVLAALLDNARQAVAAGGAVTLSAGLGDGTAREDWLGELAPGPAVVLTVADTGAGFTPEARRRVFVEPFFSTRPRHRGMGLATVYGLVRARGGGLRLEHGARGGTRVHVYLTTAAADQ